MTAGRPDPWTVEADGPVRVTAPDLHGAFVRRATR